MAARLRRRGPRPGDVATGPQLGYQIDYQGDLANPPDVTAVMIAPGGARTERRLAPWASTQQDRITKFEEDTPLPLDGWPLVLTTNAELFFDVTIEEETCRSSIIRVPSSGSKM